MPRHGLVARTPGVAAAVAMAAMALAAVTGCAGQGAEPQGQGDTVTYSAQVTAAPIGSGLPMRPLPARQAPSQFDRPCAAGQTARRVTPTPSPRPTSSPDPNSPAERSRRTLEEQAARLLPLRGAVPPRVVPAARQCASELLTRFSLLMANAPGTLDAAAIRRTLTDKGLTRIVVHTDGTRVSFAGWNGAACIFGAIPETTPTQGTSANPVGATPVGTVPTVGISAPDGKGVCQP